EALLNAPNLLLNLTVPHHLNNVRRRCARAHLLGTMFCALLILITHQVAFLVLLAAAAMARLVSSELNHRVSRRPASVIRTRAISISTLPARSRSGLAVARPSRTSSTIKGMSKPCASMTFFRAAVPA